MTTAGDYSPPLLQEQYHSVGALLAGAAEAFPDQEAYVFEGQRLTYGAWYAKAMSLAAALVARGFAPGDVGLVFLDTSIDYAICFAAIQCAGGISSGVNTRLGRREVRAIIERAAPTLIFAEQGAELPESEDRVVRRTALARLCETPSLARPVERGLNDPAVIIWTSGTTGMPKGALLDQSNLRAATATSGPMAAPFARKLNSTPFAHAGYGGKIWEQIAFGMSTIVPGQPWTAEKMLRLMVDERITIGAGVPTQWAKLLELPELDTADLSHLQIGITATAPAPPELIERLAHRLRIPFIVRYSMTECPSVTGTRVGDSPDTLFRTVGRPQPGIEVMLVDDAMRPQPQGQIGRVRIRCAQVMRGYWRDPERTAEVLSGDGWLLSGDYGYFDESGNLVLAGRTSEMYIRGGYNVYPIEVERVLAEHPKVSTSAVIGRKAPVIGEIGVAFVVPADRSAPPSLAELREAVKAELADYKAPDELVIVDALPLTSVMKVDKLALHAMLADLDDSRIEGRARA